MKIVKKGDTRQMFPWLKPPNWKFSMGNFNIESWAEEVNNIPLY